MDDTQLMILFRDLLKIEELIQGTNSILLFLCGMFAIFAIYKLVRYIF